MVILSALHVLSPLQMVTIYKQIYIFLRAAMLLKQPLYQHLSSLYNIFICLCNNSNNITLCQNYEKKAFANEIFDSLV